MKPEYAKLQVDGAWYLYDTAKNAIVPLTPAAAEVLDDFLSFGRRGVLRKFAGRMPARSLRAGVDFLHACRDARMLRPTRRLDYRRFATPPNLRRAYARGLTVMTLGITEQCNQGCRYCPFAADKPGMDRYRAMPWETARKSIDYLLAHAATEPPPTLDLYGGEPLLNWPVVERAVHYVRRELRRRDVAILLYTNATLLDRPKLEMLMAHRVALQVSLDGPPRVHDAARILADGQGTHARVMRVMQWIRRRNPAYYRRYVRPHCTFSLHDDLLEVFRYFSRPMFRELRITFGYRRGDTPAAGAEAARHEAQLDTLMAWHLRALRARRPFNRALFASIMEPVYHALRTGTHGAGCHAPQPNITCVPGQPMVFVAGDGTFHPCCNFSRGGTQIGDCQAGIDIRKAQRMLWTYATLCNRMCQNCWAWRLCTHCVLRCAGEDGRPSAQVKSKACRQEKARIIAALRRHVHLLLGEPAWASRVQDTLRRATRAPKGSQPTRR